MRRSIFSIVLCVLAVALIAARCSGDDPAAKVQDASDAAPADADAPPAPEEVPPVAVDPNAQEPDEMFKDPLDTLDAEGADEATMEGLDESGEPPASETFLSDPTFELEPKPEDLDDMPSGDMDLPEDDRP